MSTTNTVTGIRDQVGVGPAAGQIKTALGHPYVPLEQQFQGVQGPAHTLGVTLAISPAVTVTIPLAGVTTISPAVTVTIPLAGVTTIPLAVVPASSLALNFPHSALPDLLTNTTLTTERRVSSRLAQSKALTLAVVPAQPPGPVTTITLASQLNTVSPGQ